MRAEELATAIIADAKKRAKQLEEESRKEVEEFEEQTHKLLARRKREHMERVRKQEEEERKRKEAQARREASLELLRTKQELLDKVFSKAADRLAGLEGEERARLLDRLWQKATDGMDIRGVVAAERDADSLRERAEVTEVRPWSGGFVAKNKDGTVSVDLTFETLLEDVREQRLQEVANTLFAG